MQVAMQVQASFDERKSEFYKELMLCTKTVNLKDDSQIPSEGPDCDETDVKEIAKCDFLKAKLQIIE